MTNLFENLAKSRAAEAVKRFSAIVFFKNQLGEEVRGKS